MTAAFAMMVAVASPAAFAQTNPAPAAGAPMANTIQDNQIRASQFIGSTVYDVQNRNIGSVKDIIINRDGRVASVIIDVGAFLGMGGKYVAINMADIKTDNNRLTLDRSKEQLQQAQAYQLTNGNTGAGQGASPVQGGRLGR